MNDLRAVFPALAEEQLVRAARDIAGLDLLRRAVERCVRSGAADRLAPLVVTRNAVPLHALAAGQGPAILAIWHVGLMHAMRPLLQAFGIDRLSVRGRALMSSTVNDALAASGQAAEALANAASRLRAGGVVVIALDGYGNARLPAECAGRVATLARGAFMLSRVTRAPLVPVVPRWDPEARRIKVEVGEAICEASSDTGRHPADVEHTLARAAGHWLGTYLMARPGDLWLPMLRTLAQAPRATGGEVSNSNPPLSHTPFETVDRSTS